jgi:membrane fusion protein, multidrug efflux system
MRAIAVLCLLLISGTAASAQTVSDDAVAATCILKPRFTVQLGSTVTGVLSELLVDRGDAVHKGQIVARLESSVEQANLALDRTKAASDTSVKVETVDRDLAIREAARKKSLVDKGIDNENALDEIQTKAREGELRVQQAQTDQQIAALTAQRSERTLELKQIRSPIEGVVIERKLSAGEYIYEQTSIMTIAQLDPLNVELVLPQDRYGLIHIGETGTVHPAAPVGGAYKAVVEVVDPVIDAASGTFGVRLRLANPDHLIPAGIHCSVDWPNDKQVLQ